MVTVQKQRAGSSDCGLHAIANTVTIAHGENPSQIKYDQAVMRSHLVKCLSTKKIEPFPKHVWLLMLYYIFQQIMLIHFTFVYVYYLHKIIIVIILNQFSFYVIPQSH